VRELNLSELSAISGGQHNTTTVIEDNAPVVIVYQPNPFIYDLALLVVDIALRLIIEEALYDDYDYYYY